MGQVAADEHSNTPRWVGVGSTRAILNAWIPGPILVGQVRVPVGVRLTHATELGAHLSQILFDQDFLTHQATRVPVTKDKLISLCIVNSSLFLLLFPPAATLTLLPFSIDGPGPGELIGYNNLPGGPAP